MVDLAGVGLRGEKLFLVLCYGILIRDVAQSVLSVRTLKLLSCRATKGEFGSVLFRDECLNFHTSIGLD